MAVLNIAALVYEYQAIDVIGPMDLLGSGSKLLATAIKEYAPVEEKVVADAPEMAFHHIGLTLDPVLLSSGINIVPTCTVDNAPDIDILILGGPAPHLFNLDPKYAEYIRKHVAAGKLLFTNCTGAYVAALAGVLDGKNATVNQWELGWIRKRHPQVKWTDAKKWIVDGNIWTATGAVAGMDMVAYWMKENYGMDVLKLAGMNLDFEPRDVDGVLNVFPLRYDSSGKQLFTHAFKYYDSY